MEDNMTHILLLDGKLWAFEPPEKPTTIPVQCEDSPCPDSFTLDQCKCRHANYKYNRAYSLALEKKIEIDKKCFTKSTTISIDGLAKSISFTLVGNSYHLQPNEPIKWEGGFTIINACQSDVCTEDGRCEHCRDPKKLVRLIAPVKKEPTHGQKMKAIRKRADWLKYCLDIGWTKDQLPGLEKIWDDNHDEFGNLIKSPVPSEQENQEAIWKELFNLIEGPTSDRYIQAMKRFSITLK